MTTTTSTATTTPVCDWRTGESSVRIHRDSDGRLIANGRRLPPHFSAAMDLALTLGNAAPASHCEVYSSLYWGHDRVPVPPEHRCREWGIAMGAAWEEREAIMGLAALRARGLPEHLDRMVRVWIEGRPSP
jgi:hypothetical protein